MASWVQREYPLVIRVPACPMYSLTLKARGIQPIMVSENQLHRIPYYDRGCAAGRPNGYITILFNGDVISCMLLQYKLGNIRRERLKLWEYPFLLTLGYLVIGRLGATYVAVIGGLLTATLRPAFSPFTLLFALLYGLLTDCFCTLFKVKLHKSTPLG